MPVQIPAPAPAPASNAQPDVDISGSKLASSNTINIEKSHIEEKKDDDGIDMSTHIEPPAVVSSMDSSIPKSQSVSPTVYCTICNQNIMVPNQSIDDVDAFLSLHTRTLHTQ